ncbi:MAG TPA: hypothetical protein VFK85_01535 [Anaeromyxobacteraceae bacterium]|nr:hypothetical protein [Anaeromyxobacteraceae bacterium]
MDVPACDTCNTPLDGAGRCVTCAATARGLSLLSRSGYAAVREMMDLLEGAGVDAQVDPVPARRPEEKAQPLWNLYAPVDQLDRARDFLRRDWSGLLASEDAIKAAERGTKGVDLDAGGEIECPACGHRFVLAKDSPECPDCGLGLGAPADAAPGGSEG